MTLVLVKHVLAKAGNGERCPPLTPPKRGIVESPPKICPRFQSGRGIICAIIKYLVLVKTGSGFKLNTDNRSLAVSPQNPHK